MTTDTPGDSSPEITPEALAAAEALLGRLPDSPKPGTVEYIELRQKYADVCARLGLDQFELLFGLRAPRTAWERLQVECKQQGLTSEQWEERVEAHSVRPIDEDMLKDYCDAAAKRVERYKEFLQIVIAPATDQRNQNAWRTAEAPANEAIAKLAEDGDLGTEERTKIVGFLLDLRSAHGEPVRVRESSAATAHSLLHAEMDRVIQQWNLCVHLARKRQRDPAYRNTPNACHLFYTMYIEPGQFIKPSELTAVLRLERRGAEQALARSRQTKTDQSPSAPAAVRVVSVAHDVVEQLRGAALVDGTDRQGTPVNGWTKMVLMTKAGIGATTFDQIRQNAGVEPAKRGAAGPKRLYSRVELTKLIRAVNAGRHHEKKGIVGAWQALLDGK